VAALSAAGAVAAVDAVRFAAVRGRAMADAARRAPGAMLALSASEPALHALLARGRLHGWIDVAAHNAPRDWVLSGQERALSAVAAAHPATPLPVAGAWHSRAMRPAQSEVRVAAEALALAPFTMGFVATTEPGFVADEIRARELLVEQLAYPIHFGAAADALRRAGFTDVLIAGPARRLRGVLRRAWPDARLFPIERWCDVARAREALA
jgi:[acyl-carrier-protein] S-malonyltransferase